MLLGKGLSAHKCGGIRQAPIAGSAASIQIIVRDNNVD